MRMAGRKVLASNRNSTKLAKEEAYSSVLALLVRADQSLPMLDVRGDDEVGSLRISNENGRHFEAANGKWLGPYELKADCKLEEEGVTRVDANLLFGCDPPTCLWPCMER